MNLVKTICLALLLSEIGKLFVSFILLYICIVHQSLRHSYIQNRLDLDGGG